MIIQQFIIYMCINSQERNYPYTCRLNKVPTQLKSKQSTLILFAYVATSNRCPPAMINTLINLVHGICSVAVINIRTKYSTRNPHHHQRRINDELSKGKCVRIIDHFRCFSLSDFIAIAVVLLPLLFFSRYYCVILVVNICIPGFPST